MRYELDESPEEHDPTSVYFSISGLDSVAEDIEEKNPLDKFPTFENLLELGHYLIDEKDMKKAEDLLYAFEKPHKYYKDFIESQVWNQIDDKSYCFDDSGWEAVSDVFADWVSGRDEN